MKENILIVDDAEFSRTVMKQALLNAGFDNIFEATTADEARQNFSNIQPDLTVLDIMLPDNYDLKLLYELLESNKEAKSAELSYHTLARFEQLSLVEISLKTGRSHQIRVQFSSRNMPLWGDQRYNKNAKVKQQIALWATELSLIHPTTKEQMTFHCPVPNTAPWSSFNLKEGK